MKFNNFDDLFNQIFTESYLIEQETIKFLPLMIEKAQSLDLKNALQKHLSETRSHAGRLDGILLKQNIDIHKDRVCPIDAIIKQAKECLESNEPSGVLDAAIIAYMQQIEHLEIAIYGTLKEYANTKGESIIKSAIEETLKDEVKIDTILTKLAAGGFFEKGINVKAMR